MEKILFNAGLYVNSSALTRDNTLLKTNLDKRIKALAYDPGLVIGLKSDGTLKDDWVITDGGGGNFTIGSGIAILDNYEVIELESDTDPIAAIDDSATYYILVKRLETGDTPEWISRNDTSKEKGTIEVSAGSLEIDGTGTEFESILSAGDRIQLDSTTPANAVELIVDSITDDDTLTVNAVDADGDPVSFTDESDLDFWVIGKYASGYPPGALTKALVEYDCVAIVLTTSLAGLTNYIVLGTIARTGSTLAIVDMRDQSLLEVYGVKNSQRSQNQVTFDGYNTICEKNGGVTIFAAGTSISTETIIDDSIDFRYRMIFIEGFVSTNGSGIDGKDWLPGGAESPQASMNFIVNAGTLDANSKDHLSGMFYSGAGGDGTNYIECNNGTRLVKFYCTTDGELAVISDGATYRSGFMIRVSASPKFS